MGRLRGLIIRKLIVSFILSVVVSVIAVIIVYITTSDGTVAEDFADYAVENAPKEISDIEDIADWSGWKKIDPKWHVEVYNKDNEVVYAKNGLLSIRRVSIYTEREFKELGGRLVINSITGTKTQTYINFLPLLSWLSFLLFFTLLFRKIEKYTYEISDGISILAGGEMSHEIAVKGKNELSMIASNINGLAKALYEKTEEKKKSDKERDDMITNLAHDIRTPITVLEGYLSILINDKNMTKEKEKEYLEISLSKCTELSSRADNIFEYVRLNNKREQLDFYLVEARQYITEKFEEMTMILAREGFKFKVDIELKEKKYIRIDKALTQRVFDNLLSNIVKYADKECPVVFWACLQDDYVAVSIRNKAKDKITVEPERLFERTVSGDLSRKGKSEGLGLSICKLIMEMQNGRIEAHTQDDFLEISLKFLN